MPFDVSALETLEIIQAIRFSRWGYAAINAAHILGISLLVGGAVPMALRLFGVWGQTSKSDILKILVTTTASGLCLALATGFILFATRASEYVGNPAFLFKLIFVSAGTLSALFAHFLYGRTLDGASSSSAGRIAGVSLLCWIGALVAGRLIAFV